MHTFAQKPKVTQQTTSAKSTIPGREHFGQSREVNSILHLQRTIGNQAVQRLLEASTEDGKGDSTTTEIARFGHDFSRIPVHATTPVAVQHGDSAVSSTIYTMGGKKPDGQHQEDEHTEPLHSAPFTVESPEMKLHAGSDYFAMTALSAVQLRPSFGKNDQEPNLAIESQEVPTPLPPQIAPTESALAPEETVSGTIPDITTPPEEGRQTGEAEFTEDIPTPGGVGNVVADIRLNFSQPKTDRHNGGKHDAVVSGVSIGSFSQPSGRAVSPFGSEFYEPAFTGISHAFAGGKCTITANLDVVCPWGTNAGLGPDGNPRIDVPSATDAVVTKAKWPDIKADLQPGAASPFKSPRTKYYSQSLVEKHEKFHGTDDNGWTSASGLGIVKADLEAGTVASASAAADVATLVNGARAKLISENTKWYKGPGAAHGSYAGEIRAYADGKSSYQTLADAVETHGKTLP